jgi:O-antigen/teichoic acid export membrane protein
LKLVLKNLNDNKVILKYLGSSFISLPVSMVTGFISFRSIEPALMGIWASMTIYETYVNFLRLGIVNGMNRELPFAQGSGNTKLALEYAETTLSYTIINIGIICIAFICAFLLFSLNIFEKAALIALFIKAILSFYSTYLAGTYRSDNQFDKVSKIQLYTIAGRLLLCPMVLLGFYGYITYILLDTFINTLLYHSFRPFRGKFKFSLLQITHLFKIGFPIYIASYFMSIVETIPRLFIVTWGTLELLGIYAPCILLLNTMSMLPSVLSSYLYPKLSFSFGKFNDKILVWNTFLKINCISFIFLVFLSFFSFLLVDYIMIFFPKYSTSIQYIKLTLIAGPFVFYKLGYMINVIFKNYINMNLFVIVYAILQVSTIFIWRLIIDDVLKIAIFSQFFTWLFLILFGMLLNKHSINSTLSTTTK